MVEAWTISNLQIVSSHWATMTLICAHAMRRQWMYFMKKTWEHLIVDRSTKGLFWRTCSQQLRYTESENILWVQNYCERERMIVISPLTTMDVTLWKIENQNKTMINHDYSINHAHRMLQIAITNKRLKIYCLSIFFTWFENSPIKYIIILNFNYFHKTAYNIVYLFIMKCKIIL